MMRLRHIVQDVVRRVSHAWLSRAGAAKGTRLCLKVALVAVSVGLTFVVAEAGYRVHLKRKAARCHYSYRVTPTVYVEYSEPYGESLKPNAQCWVSHVRRGRVVWGNLSSRSNRDGLGGRTTIREYENADVRILVFGDSFSHWNQNGVTWPDLLEGILSEQLGRQVRVLNYARGTYGVLQMIDLAADKVEEHRPDLVILAAIGDDFTRARWWAKEIQRDGITRWMLSSRKDDFLDYRVAVDELLVHPEATQEWCRRQLSAPDERDPILAVLNARYAKLHREIESVRRPIQTFSLTRSYLLTRIVHGTAFRAAPPQTVPRIDYRDYRCDPQTSLNLRRLEAAGVPLLLVYLPLADEVKTRTLLVTDQTRELISSLEQTVGAEFCFLQQEYQGEPPGKLDLLPYDSHPSPEGLEFYARTIANVVCAKLGKVP